MSHDHPCRGQLPARGSDGPLGGEQPTRTEGAEREVGNGDAAGSTYSEASRITKMSSGSCSSMPPAAASTVDAGEISKVTTVIYPVGISSFENGEEPCSSCPSTRVSSGRTQGSSAKAGRMWRCCHMSSGSSISTAAVLTAQKLARLPTLWPTCWPSASSQSLASQS